MTLNCKDLSFYIKNKNFIIQQKIADFFEKYYIFPQKCLNL